MKNAALPSAVTPPAYLHNRRCNTSGCRLYFVEVANGHECNLVRRHQEPRAPYCTCNPTGGGDIVHLVHVGQVGCVISDFIVGWQICTLGHDSQTHT